MDYQFMFHWPTKLCIYIWWGPFLVTQMKLGMNLKYHYEICGNELSSCLIFSNTHLCSFPNGSVWLELAESAAERVALLQLLVYARWSSRHDWLGCHAPLMVAMRLKGPVQVSIQIRLPRYGLTIRQPYDCLIFIIWIPVLVSRHL